MPQTAFWIPVSKEEETQCGRGLGRLVRKLQKKQSLSSQKHKISVSPCVCEFLTTAAGILLRLVGDDASSARN